MPIGLSPFQKKSDGIVIEFLGAKTIKEKKACKDEFIEMHAHQMQQRRGIWNCNFRIKKKHIARIQKDFVSAISFQLYLRSYWEQDMSFHFYLRTYWKNKYKRLIKG